MSATPSTRSELLERLRAEIAYVARKTGVPADPDAARLLVEQADAGLRRLFDDGAQAELSDDDAGGLEAIVRTDGSRPVLFVEDDFIDPMAPTIGGYEAGLSRLEASVRRVCRSVGRVDDPTAALGYQGTAWMIGDGLVVTNYHVLDAIAPGGVRHDGTFEGRLRTGAAVHFGHEVSSELPDRRFPIKRVVRVGRAGAAEHNHPSIVDLNFDGLDLAVLELEPVPGRSFPEPITVARGDDPHTRGGLASKGRGIYLVGYPGKAHISLAALFKSIFGEVASYKRLAPGEIMAPAGQVEHDPRGWVLTHDASTLGGNSGSVLVDFDGSSGTALGLHFAGEYAAQNWAHALERITTDLDPMLPRPQP